MTTKYQLRLNIKQIIKSQSSFQGDQIGIRQISRHLRQGLMAAFFRFNGSTIWMILSSEGLHLQLRMKYGDSSRSGPMTQLPLGGLSHLASQRLSAAKVGITWLLYFTGSFERGFGPPWRISEKIDFSGCPITKKINFNKRFLPNWLRTPVSKSATWVIPFATRL